jgi:hypothetical protein
MTARFRISARVQQQKSKPPEATMITSINPGESTSDWQSEKVFSVDQLKALFNAASDKKKVTFLLEFHYAIKVFPKGKSIDFISVEIKDWTSNNTILIPTCKDLKVANHTTAGDGQTAVTLQLSSRFTF